MLTMFLHDLFWVLMWIVVQADDLRFPSKRRGEPTLVCASSLSNPSFFIDFVFETIVFVVISVFGLRSFIRRLLRTFTL